MSSEVKQRKKGAAKETKDVQRSAPGPRTQDEKPGKAVGDSPGSAGRCPELRTLLCLLCVAVCGALTWLVIQQSHNFAVIEQKYQSLQQRSAALDALEDKVQLLFGKLVSTEDILTEVTSSSTVMTRLQQQVSSLHNDIDGIHNNEQALSKKMQNVNSKFQNITDEWQKSLGEMNINTDSVKSEAKSFHNQITMKINDADQTLKSLKERLKDLEESTKRNSRTVKRQEDNELFHVKEVLDWDTNAIEELEKEQSALAGLHVEIKQSLVEFAPKVEECVNSLPTIESGIRSILKVSNEMIDLDKRVNEMTVQVFSTEDNLLKVISEILEIQHALERMKLDNSVLKMQNDIDQLKEKTFNLSADKNDDLVVEEEKDPDNHDD
ncbi:inhibitor of nuclear factor kappa-B kinase-interacting protein isoform 1-T1 [Discoglossus pictus]